MENKKINWIILSILFSFGWALIYFDRTMLTPIMKNILDDLNITEDKMGIIFSTFFLGYTLLQIPGGILGEKIGVTKVIKICFLLLAVISLITGYISSFIVFMIFRTLSGAVEGIYYGPQFAYSSSVIDKKNKVFATTIINSGMSLGIILGTYLPTYLIIKNGYSYKMLFYILTTLCLILFYILNKILPEVIQVRKIEKFKMNRELYKIFFISFCSLYGFFHILTWLSKYLLSEKNLEYNEVSLFIAIIPIISIFSALIFSKLIDKYRKIKLFTIILLIFTSISLVIIIISTNKIYILFGIILYGIFGKLALDPILIVATSNSSETQNLSTTLAVFNFVGLLSSVIAPFIGGKSLQLTNSLNISFYISFILLIFAIFISFRLKKI